MPRIKYSTEQIIHKLREADVLLAQRRTVAETCKQLGMSEQTYFRWRKSHGGLRIDQAKRMRELEAENARPLLWCARSMRTQNDGSAGRWALHDRWCDTYLSRARMRRRSGSRSLRWLRNCAGCAIWTLRLSACDGAAVLAGMAGRSYARRADLAARGAEGAAEAAEARPALARRWVVYPPAPEAPQSRLKLGLRDGADGGW